MATVDKDFKVKNKLVISGLTNANGVLLSENHAVDYVAFFFREKPPNNKQ